MDDAVLEAAQRGDPAALARVLDTLAPSLHRFALRMCGGRPDADDALQDALLAIASHLPEYERRSSLTSWAFAVMRSACSHRRRGLKNRPAEPIDVAIDTPDGASDPERRAEHRELLAAVQRALTALPDEHREVLLLRDAEGLSANETAAALGLSLEAMKSRLHRARRALHEALRPMREAEVAGPACPDVIEAWSTEHEGDLRAEDCARLQKHLDGCTRCGALCDALRREVGVCSALGRGPVSPAVKTRVEAALSSWRAARA